MATLIGDRTIMKHEVNSGLYNICAFIIPSTFMNLAVDFTANTIFIVIMFLLGGFNANMFWPLFFWVSLLFFTFCATKCFCRCDRLFPWWQRMWQRWGYWRRYRYRGSA